MCNSDKLIDSFLRKYWSDGIMYNNKIVRFQFVSQEKHSVSDRIMSCIAAFNDPFNFSQRILIYYFPSPVDPILYTHNQDLIDPGISLKIPDRISDYGFAVNLKELLGYIGSHSLSDAPGKDDRVISHKTACSLLIKFQQCIHKDLHVLLMGNSQSQPSCKSLLSAEDKDTVLLKEICDLS